MNRKERRASKRRKGALASSFGGEVDRLFALAVQHHQAGQLNEAILYYQWAIDRRPDFVAARNNSALPWPAADSKMRQRSFTRP
jgi:hypothetical protein